MRRSLTLGPGLRTCVRFVVRCRRSTPISSGRYLSATSTSPTFLTRRKFVWRAPDARDGGESGSAMDGAAGLAGDHPRARALTPDEIHLGGAGESAHYLCQFLEALSTGNPYLQKNRRSAYSRLFRSISCSHKN